MGFGTIIHRFTTSCSTSDAAREMAKGGAPHGTVVVAEEQTRGRGTKGRTWHSMRGRGLYVSFVLRPDGDVLAQGAFPLLPLAAGLAALDAIGLVGVGSVGLKWPNDLFWDRRKLGGVLTESVFRGAAADYSIIGIGINVLHEESDFPADLRSVSTSLRLISGHSIDSDVLLGHLCSTLEDWYNVVVMGWKAKIIRAFEDNSLFHPGDRIIVGSAGDPLSGIYSGIDAEGRLLVRTKGGIQTVSAEEVRALDWE